MRTGSFESMVNIKGDDFQGSARYRYILLCCIINEYIVLGLRVQTAYASLLI